MKKFVSVLTVFALLFSVFASFATVSVAATGDNDPPLSTNQVYYITDSYTADDTYHNVFQNIVGNQNFSMYNNTSQTYFWEDIYMWENDHTIVGPGTIPEYDEIENSVIIFEVDQGLPLDNSTVFSVSYFDILSSLFSTLKENGCYILFKCSTDESRFSVNNEFLNYVDFHINTDLMTVFAESVFRYIETEYGDINNVTFLISNRCLDGNPDTYADPNRWGFYNYLSAYLKKRFEEELATESYEDVLEDHSIYIFNQASGTSFYNVFDRLPCDITSSVFSRDYLSGNYVIAIGSFAPLNGVDANDAHDFVSAINLLQDVELDVPLFLFNPNSVVHTNRYPDKTYSMDGNTLYFNQIDDIICDFILEADCSGSQDEQSIASFQSFMSIYDNWPSQCLLCYKPIALSEDTWICAPTGEDNEIFWGIIPTSNNDLRAYGLPDVIYYFYY